MSDELQNQNQSEIFSSEPEEMSLIDKLIGVLVEPSRVFEYIKVKGSKTVDWLIPILLLIVFTILSSWTIMQNPEIKADLDAKQRAAIEENLDKAVKEGKITQQQKEEQLEQIEKFTGGPAMQIIQYISIAVFMFVFLFVLSGVYFFIWTFLLKGQGKFSDAVSVYGLSTVISLIEVILVAIVSLLMAKLINGISVAAFLDVEKGTTLSYALSKINPFTFWWLYVIGVGLSKVFVVPKGKSLITIFALWFVYVVIAKFIPFLSFGA